MVLHCKSGISSWSHTNFHSVFCPHIVLDDFRYTIVDLGSCGLLHYSCFWWRWNDLLVQNFVQVSLEQMDSAGLRPLLHVQRLYDGLHVASVLNQHFRIFVHALGIRIVSQRPSSRQHARSCKIHPTIWAGRISISSWVRTFSDRNLGPLFVSRL